MKSTSWNLERPAPRSHGLRSRERRAPATLLALLALLAAACAGAPSEARAAAAAASETGIQWQPDFASALKTARKQHQDILVDFYTSWCKWCKVQDDSTYGAPSFAEFSRKYVWVRLDAEQDTGLARKYRIGLFPTVVVMKSDGTEYDRVLGYTHDADFRHQVEDYCAGRNTLAAKLAEEPAHAGDSKYLYELADNLNFHGRPDDALARYRKVFDSDSDSVSGAYGERAGFMLARALRRDGKWGQALEAYQSALRRFPHGPLRANLLYGLALTYKGTADKDRAVAAFEKFVAENPQSPDLESARREIDGLKNPSVGP